MNLNRIAAVMLTVAALSTGNVAAATETEEKSLFDAASVAADPRMFEEPVLKRPAILPALYVTFGAMQAWDVFSTTAALKAGAREANPVAAPFVGNPGSMIGLKVMSTASAIYFAERMWKKSRVQAIVVLAAINGASAAISIHNMRTARAASGQR